MKYNLFIGRFSPFHNGHKYIIDTFVNNKQPVCIAVRESEEIYPVSLRISMVKAVYIDELKSGLVKVITIPDIEQVCVGREVGYALMEVPQNIRVISATEIRDSIARQRPDKYGFWSDKVPQEVKELIKLWEANGD